MEKKIKPMVLTAFLFAGFVFAAGIWLITETGPAFHPERPLLPDSRVADKPSSETAGAKPDPIPSPEYDSPVPAAAIGTADVKTFRHLRLIGIAMDADTPYAIILNEKKNKQDLFRIGDLADGAVIRDILNDRVVLQYRDQVFTLVLESVLNEEKDLVPIASESQPGHVLSYMDQADIETAWEETQDLMNQIEFSQFEENDEARGVVVGSVMENSIFEKIGFRPGDIILQVDEMVISIEDDAMEIYNCLRTRNSASFKVNRNDETIILKYPAEIQSD